MLFTNNLKNKIFISLFLVFSLLFFAACASDSNSSSEEGEHTMEEEHGEHEHEEERIPNPDGAAVTLLAPADGATFADGEEIIVEVEIDNFAIGEDGNHWHVYIDGTSWGMVMGENTSESIRGLEAGEHLVEVYIAGGDHIEFEEGDSVTITVE